MLLGELFPKISVALPKTRLFLGTYVQGGPLRTEVLVEQQELDN
jgi:hypothetical protein